MTLKIPDTLRKQLEKATTIIERIFEEDLLVIHLYGSAVEGGLKPHSDIDLLVTTRVPLTTAQREALMQELLSVSARVWYVDAWRALEVTVVVHTDVVPRRFLPDGKCSLASGCARIFTPGSMNPHSRIAIWRFY